MYKSKILFKLTGSIACYKACNVISKLTQLGHEVQVVGSKGSKEFIGASTIEGLTGKPFITDLYEPGHNMAHIHLMRWADLIVVAPASAHFINRIAAGVGDDLLTTLYLAHDFKKPYLIAPAMNTSMYLHPTTQNSMTTLKALGIKILEAASGVLACGETGWGRLIEPELLLNEIISHLPSQPAPAGSIKPTTSKTDRSTPRVLITAGGTSEPLDAVRVISNRSTGNTARAIADYLLQYGFDVDFLHASNVKPLPSANNYLFDTFSKYQTELECLLKQHTYNATILAAAVSDFSVSKINGQNFDHFVNTKIPSNENLIVEFKNNPKIINTVKSLGGDQLLLVGFKMTTNAPDTEIKKKVEALFAHANCDLILHNDTKDFKFGDIEVHPFNIFERKSNHRTQNLQELSGFLATKISEHYLKPKETK